MSQSALKPSPQTISTCQRLSWHDWASLVTGVLLVLLASVLQDPHLAMAAVLPLSWSLGGFILFPAEMTLELADDHLLVLPQNHSIPYRSIRSVSIRNNVYPVDHSAIPAGAILLIHDEGELEIPRSLDVSSPQFYRELLRRLPRLPASAVPIDSPLEPHYRSQVELFGTDRVIYFNTRPNMGRLASQKHLTVRGLLIALAGLLWITLGIVFDDSLNVDIAWIGLGWLGVFLGIIIVVWRSCQNKLPMPVLLAWKHAELLISPIGIFLVQHQTRGKLKWQELKNVIMPAPALWIRLTSHSEESAGPALRLEVAGAQIQIFDVFNLPLPKIYELIIQYWRPPTERNAPSASLASQQDLSGGA